MAKLYPTSNTTYVWTTQTDEVALFSDIYTLLKQDDLSAIDRSVIEAILLRLDEGKSPSVPQVKNLATMFRDRDLGFEIKFDDRGDLATGQADLAQRRQRIHREVRAEFGLNPELPAYTHIIDTRKGRPTNPNMERDVAKHIGIETPGDWWSYREPPKPEPKPTASDEFFATISPGPFVSATPPRISQGELADEIGKLSDALAEIADRLSEIAQRVAVETPR